MEAPGRKIARRTPSAAARRRRTYLCLLLYDLSTRVSTLSANVPSNNRRESRNGPGVETRGRGAGSRPPPPLAALLDRFAADPCLRGPLQLCPAKALNTKTFHTSTRFTHSFGICMKTTPGNKSTAAIRCADWARLPMFARARTRVRRRLGDACVFGGTPRSCKPADGHWSCRKHRIRKICGSLHFSATRALKRPRASKQQRVAGKHAPQLLRVDTMGRSAS